MQVCQKHIQMLPLPLISRETLQCTGKGREMVLKHCSSFFGFTQLSSVILVLYCVYFYGRCLLDRGRHNVKNGYVYLYIYMCETLFKIQISGMGNLNINPPHKE